ncbi:MAG: O-antigen ligase family protein [Deltaproteobacteria bacterium]|nr:O-antigen ligase family protein [Deltaproteobacteria bacterium]
MPTRKPPRLDRFIEVLVLAILIDLPIAFAGVGWHRRAPAIVAASVLAIALAARAWRGPPPSDVAGRRLDVPLALWGLFAASAAAQLLPVPASWAAWLGASENFVPGRFAPTHPAPDKAVVSLLTYGVAFTLYYAITRVYRSRGQMRRLIGVIIAVGAFEAFYGLVVWGSGSGEVLGHVKRAYVDVATGTFINRNHYAAYLAMTLCLAAASAIDAIDRSSRRTKARDGVFEKAVIVGFVVMLGLGAMFAAGSRAAPICFAVAAGAIGFVYQRDQLPKRIWPALVVFSVCLFAFLIWIGVEPLNPRWAHLTEEARMADARPRVYAACVRVWSHAPIFGTGLGTFADAFAMYRPKEILAYYDHAHNDYLEMAIETGIVGFALFYGGVVAVFRRTVKAVRDRQSRFARTRALGALAGVLAIGLHGLVDFNLSVPANLVTAFALLAIAVTVSERHLMESRT